MSVLLAIRQEAPRLHCPQFGIMAAQDFQFFMGAVFDSAAFIENQNSIHVGQSGKSESNHDRCAPFHEAMQAPADVFFGDRIQRRMCVA